MGAPKGGGHWAGPPYRFQPGLKVFTAAQRWKGVWLRKPRVDKGTILLPPSDVTYTVHVLCPPWGDPAELSHPSRQWKRSPSTCEGAQARESFTVPCRRVTLAPDVVPAARSETLPGPTPKPHRASRCPTARRAKSSGVSPGEFRAHESSAGVGRSRRQEPG